MLVLAAGVFLDQMRGLLAEGPMAEEPKPELKEERARPGIGLPAWLVSLAAVVLAVAARPDLGLFAGFFAVGVAIWYSLAPLTEEEAGEGVDPFAADPFLKDPTLGPKEWFINNFAHPTRRYSPVVIGLGLLACLIAASRLRLG